MAGIRSFSVIDGTYTVAATIVDDAGNTDTDSQSAVIDTIGPELTIVPSFLLGNLVSLSGTSDLPAAVRSPSQSTSSEEGLVQRTQRSRCGWQLDFS